jgi:DNA-binding CsgD family transcriptional regulator
VVQCTPYLIRLFAELSVYYYLMFYECLTDLLLQKRGLDALEDDPPYLVCSTDTDGILRIGINPAADVVLPLVDDMETNLKQVGSPHDLWEPLSRWLSVSYHVLTIMEMEDALGEETLAAMSEDQWLTTFNAYAYGDKELYNNTMLYLLQGYAHWRILDMLSRTQDWLFEQLAAYCDLQAVWEPARDDDARVRAATRVVHRLGHCVARQRWPLVQPALAQQAAQHRRSPEDELRQLAIARLFEVIVTITPHELANVSLTHKALRRRLNNLLTMDLLGPEWQKKHLIQDQCPPGLDLETRITVQELLDRSSLTPRECEVIDAILRDEDPQEIASYLGIRPETVRVHVSNARKKMALYLNVSAFAADIR